MNLPNPLVVLSILLTAFCWGIYGPVLHRGQNFMSGEGGRLRAFICVGIAYFLIAIVVPVAVMYLTGWEAGNDAKGKPYAFTTWGTMWSLAGGIAGAVGALGIILALSYGGSPGQVMPVVFGLAPVINTLYVMYTSKNVSAISPFYAAGLILSIAGAVTVLTFAPKPAPHGPAKEAKHVEPQTDDVDAERALIGNAHAAERAEYERVKADESENS